MNNQIYIDHFKGTKFDSEYGMELYYQTIMPFINEKTDESANRLINTFSTTKLISKTSNRGIKLSNNEYHEIKDSGLIDYIYYFKLFMYEENPVYVKSNNNVYYIGILYNKITNAKIPIKIECSIFNSKMNADKYEIIKSKPIRVSKFIINRGLPIQFERSNINTMYEQLKIIKTKMPVC